MLQKLNQNKVRQTLNKKGIFVFSPLDLMRIFGVSESATRFFINYHIRTGLFGKIKNGLYILAEKPANNYCIANRLYQPSYVSFDTALSFHKLIPETIYSITSATSRISRVYNFNNIEFVYHKIKKIGFTGYAPTKYLGEIAFIAEPEKALIDYLYLVDLHRRQFSYERLSLNNINKKRLLFYAELFQRPSLLSLANKIYAQFK